MRENRNATRGVGPGAIQRPASTSQSPVANPPTAQPEPEP